MTVRRLWSKDVSVQEIITAVETELAEPLYRGVSLGCTFQDLRLAYRGVGAAQPGLMEWLRATIRLLIWPVRGADPRRSRPGAEDAEKGRVLFASISKRDYSIRVIPRIVTHLGESECHVLTKLPQMRGVLPKSVGVFPWRDAPNLKLRSWRSEYSRCAKGWNDRLRDLQSRFGLSSYAVLLIRQSLILASQRFDRYQSLIDSLRPRAVLVDFDRNPRAACLILAARKRGIPTFTLVHGAAHGPDFFMPIVADRVLCWGEHQREIFIQNGTEPDRVEIVGFQRIDDHSNVDPAEVRSRIGVPPKAVVAMYASNPIERAARTRILRLFCEAVHRAPNITGVVRLHPDEAISDYSEIVASFPSVRFTANNEFTPAEALTIADIVVAHSSGFAGEAVARGRLGVVLDAVGVPLGPGEDLVAWAGAPRAQNAMELAEVLSRVLTDDEFRRDLEEGGRRYSRRMYAATGDEACRNIATAVERYALSV